MWRRRCKETGESKVILTTLCGHGHFDMSSYAKYLDGGLKVRCKEQLFKHACKHELLPTLHVMEWVSEACRFGGAHHSCRQVLCCTCIDTSVGMLGPASRDAGTFMCACSSIGAMLSRHLCRHKPSLTPVLTRSWGAHAALPAVLRLLQDLDFDKSRVDAALADLPHIPQPQ